MAERHALVIGISHYKYLGKLETVGRDVEEIASILETPGVYKYKVERYPYKYIEAEDRYEVKDKEVTKKKLLETITDFLFKTAANSDALLYFSGHGLQFSESEYLEPKGGLAVYNSQKDGENVLLFSDLNQLFLKARKKAHLSSLLVILDCCHAGMIIENSVASFESAVDQTILPSEFSAFNQESGYALLAACRGNQQAYYTKGGTSVLTQRVLEGLKPERVNKNGVITFFNLAEFVKTKLVDQGQHSIDLTNNASDLPIISYDSQPEKGEEKSDFFKVLCQLNFEQEDGIFANCLYSDYRVGAFFIGSQMGRGAGQLWLMERFWRRDQLFVDAINYLLPIKRNYSLETLWDRFHSRFSSTIENNPTEMVEEIYEHWSNNKTVVVGLIGIENLEQSVIQNFVLNIWEPLSQKVDDTYRVRNNIDLDQQEAQMEPANKGTKNKPSASNMETVENDSSTPLLSPLLLFLVDTGLKDNFNPGIHWSSDSEDSQAKSPILLILEKLKNDKITIWANQNKNPLEKQLTQKNISFNFFKNQVIELNKRDDTCTEDILDEICQLCSQNFYENRKFSD